MPKKLFHRQPKRRNSHRREPRKKRSGRVGRSSRKETRVPLMRLKSCTVTTSRLDTPCITYIDFNLPSKNVDPAHGLCCTYTLAHWFLHHLTGIRKMYIDRNWKRCWFTYNQG